MLLFFSVVITKQQLYLYNALSCYCETKELRFEVFGTFPKDKQNYNQHMYSKRANVRFAKYLYSDDSMLSFSLKSHRKSRSHLNHIYQLKY